ncbi:MAG TPA: aminotransferase class V-fold PLP-dependent enzyme [Candidatus Limnocylindrales bacterium]
MSDERDAVPETPGRRRAALAARWALDPEVVFLNHGSFGACPRGVLDAQQALRAEMEANPVAFLARRLEDRLAAARAAVGAFVGADPDDLAFVPNATAGIATVLGSFGIGPGDELLATDHEYNAALNALRVGAADAGARVVLARIPLPVGGPDDVVERVLAAVTPRTRLALLSHVTSPTALVFPVERLVPLLEARGVAVLVDGAHAPGMIPLHVGSLGASWYVANLHKWCCAPKGAAFLHVRRDRQAAARPLAVSHAANDPRPAPSPFVRAFDWTGTLDPTAYLAAPIALAAVGAMLEGGWPAVMARNSALALGAREILLGALGGTAIAPSSMLGAMAAVELPAAFGPPPVSPVDEDPLQAALRERAGIEVPLVAWPRDPGPGERRWRLVRISAHLHNELPDYVALADALRGLLGRATNR